MDQRLAGDVRLHVGFVRNLYDRGLLVWADDPKQSVTVFFVQKQKGALRMVIDA